MSHKLVSLIILSICLNTFSQNFNKYQRSIYLYDINQPEVKAFEDCYIGLMKNIKPEYQEQRKRIYKERHDDFLKGLKNENFIFNDQLNKYVASLFEEIKKKNPIIQKYNIRLFISRSDEVNAYSLGEGTIVFNLGLIKVSENEAQLAFTLCHELAHVILNHSEIDLQAYLDLKNDKNKKKEIRKASQKEYGANTEIIKILTSHSMRLTKESRIQELQADSLGFELFKKTSFSVLEPIRDLEILDSVDVKIDSSRIKNVFNLKSYKFKDEWLMEEELISFGQDFVEKMKYDSLKTHPDCKKRIAQLTKMLGNQAVTQPKINLQLRENFLKIRKIVDYELIISCIDKKKYSMGLYYSLCAINKYGKESEFLINSIGKLLLASYHAQKNHELGKSVLRPSSDYHPNINEINCFYNNISLTEIGKLAFYFMKENKINESEESLYLFYEACTVNEKYSEREEIKKEYLKHFPNGKYVQQFNLESKNEKKN